MGESAAARKAREAAEAEQAQDQAPETEAAPGASTAPSGDEVPSSTDLSGGAPGADSGDPGEVVLWMATSTLPNPAGGTHRPGETFEATRSDPRARSNFARRHHDTGDAAPPEVESALDAPGV